MPTGHTLEVDKSSTGIEMLVWTPKDATDFRWFVDGKSATFQNLLQHEAGIQHVHVPTTILKHIPELGSKRSAMNCIFRLESTGDEDFPECISLRYTRRFRLTFNLTIVRQGTFLLYNCLSLLSIIFIKCFHYRYFIDLKRLINSKLFIYESIGIYEQLNLARENLTP